MTDKRKIGRPATGRTPSKTVRMSDERWDALGEKAKDAGSNRSEVVNKLAAWYTREDGAELPDRP